MAISVEQFPSIPEEPEQSGQVAGASESEPTEQYVDYLSAHLQAQALSIDRLAAMPAEESVVALDGFARQRTRQLAEKQWSKVLILPEGMIKVKAHSYFEDITEAPAHRDLLIRRWVPYALRNSGAFPQITIADHLHAELRAGRDPLRFRVADLVAIYGLTVADLPGTNQKRR